MGPMGLGFPTPERDDHGWKLYIVSLVMIITAGLTVAGRLATRTWLRKLGWDDATITVSLMFSIVVSVAMQLAIENGYGVHKADLTPTELTTSLRLFFIAQTPYKVTVCLNKVSVILLYMRIFVSQKFRISCWVVMGIVVAWSIGAIFSTIFQCVPIEGAWNKTVPAKCIDSGKFWIAYAVANILTDAMVMALPIPSILGLQLGWRDKTMLCCLFLVGGFVTVTSILRTTSVSNSLKNESDITWNFIDRGIWTLIEANLGIICACLPVLKHPFSKLFPRIFASTAKGTSYYANGSHDRQKGYNLSNLSSKESNQGIWRGTAKSHQVVSITSPKSQLSRTSDEQYIISDPSRESDNGVDSVDSAAGKYGISKKVEMVRTSFHEDSR